MPPLPPPSQRVRPVNRLASAAAACRAEGVAYGKCIMVDYNNVTKDKCAAEFQALKACYTAALKKGK